MAGAASSSGEQARQGVKGSRQEMRQEKQGGRPVWLGLENNGEGFGLSVTGKTEPPYNSKERSSTIRKARAESRYEIGV